jgi:ankyrin repeat protein
MDDENISLELLTTPICQACFNGEIDLVRLLVQNINISDTGGVTPLMVASFKGHYRITEFLLSAGAEVEKKDDLGHTPLIWASMRDQLEIVKLLVRYGGANVNAVDVDLYTPLILTRSVDVARFLITEGRANINAMTEGGTTPLLQACYFGNVPMVHLLVENGAIILADSLEYSKQNKPEIYEYLVDHLTRMKRGRENTRKYKDELIERSYDPSRIMQTGLAWSEFARSEGDTYLIHSASNGDLDGVKRALSGGANINETNSLKQTALHNATYYCHQDVIGYLLAREADKKLRDSRGNTPYDVAKLVDCSDQIKVMLI